MSDDRCIICGSWRFDGSFCPACDGDARIAELEQGLGRKTAEAKTFFDDACESRGIIKELRAKIAKNEAEYTRRRKAWGERLEDNRGEIQDLRARLASPTLVDLGELIQTLRIDQHLSIGTSIHGVVSIHAVRWKDPQRFHPELIVDHRSTALYDTRVFSLQAEADNLTAKLRGGDDE